MKLKKYVLALTILMQVIYPVFSYAELNFINNTSRDFDYKLEYDKVENIKDKINSNEETNSEDAGRNIEVNNKIISYLVENNIISRESFINFNGDIFVENNLPDLKAYMDKSEFLMGVYKAIYGTIDSRPIHVNGNVYVSPNVTELYLSELINKSIISYDELTPITVQELQSRNSDIKPMWDNTLGPYNGELHEVNVLGNRNVLYNNEMSVTNSNTFFINESILTIHALELIEDILRLTENNMSDTEANMIAYKYGSSYILDFPEETRKTITYLIAMGVLDFENPDEFGNIYDNLSNEFAYTLMYRLHNKAGRKDFSKIQLTDSEDQLLKLGFVEQKLTQVDNFDGVMPSTVEVQENALTDGLSYYPNNNGLVAVAPKNNDNKFVKSREVKFASKKTDTKSFTISKEFIDVDNTRYKGTRIRDLKQGNEIKEIKTGDKSTIIKFIVDAPSAVQALASIDSRITITSQSAQEKGNIDTITHIEEGGNKVSYISSKELGNKMSEIAIINSKTLKNKVTGDTAMLLQDSNLALVGNTIIRSDGDMVTRINGEEYYNMDMIVPLMTNAYISKIDPGKLYCNVELPKEEIVPVKANGDTIVEYVPIVKLSKDPLVSSTSKYFYNVNMITRGVSTLIRKFTLSDKGKPVNATIVLNWSYSVPEDSAKYLQNLSNKDFSVKAATEFLYTRPSEGNLRNWWDSNIELSNALANVMYGTTKEPQRYVTSGYMAPNVDILVEKSDLTEDEVVRQLFSKMKLPSSYVQKFLNGNIRDFHKILFNDTGDNVNARRRFNVYNAISHTSNGKIVSYADNYVTYPTGAIYKQVSNDPRLKYIVSENEKFIELNTRVKEEIQNVSNTKVLVTLPNGNKEVMYFRGYSGTNYDGNFIRIQPLKPLEGKAEKVGDTWDLRSTDGKYLIEQFYKDLEEYVPKGMLRIDLPPEQMALEPPENNYKNGYYIIRNSLKKVEVKNNEPKVKTVTETTKTVKAYPVIYLSRHEFKLKKIEHEDAGYELVMERTNPYTETSNIFFSGLNSSLISRVLDKDQSAVPLSKLPAGASVVLGDIRFRKTNGELHSVVIHDKNKVNAITNGAKSSVPDQGIRTEILKLFQGISLTYSGRGDDSQIPFTSYITSAGLGGLSHLDTSTDGLINDTLFQQGNSLKIAKTESDIRQMTATDTPQSVVISLVTDENILYRLIDEKNKVYELVTNTDKFAEGYIDNVSLFYETLDLTINDDLLLAVEGNKFTPLTNAEEFVNKMAYEYRQALFDDGEGMFKRVLVVVLSYSIIMSWIVFFILKLNVGKQLLYSLKEAFETYDSEGLDLVKVFTFGLFNLDSDILSSSLFLGNMLLFALLHLVLVWI